MSKDFFLEKLQKLQETDQITRKSKDQKKLALLKEILLAYLQGMSDEEIAIKVGYSNTANVRSRITEICAYFNVKNEEGTREQRLRLKLLFRDNKSFLQDEFFEFWKAITNVDKNLEESISTSSNSTTDNIRSISKIIDRTQPSTNPQNIPTPDRTQELTTLEFIGRDDEVNHIHNLTDQGAKCILILAPGGVGKTILARNYLKQVFDSYIEFPIAKERRNIASIASLVEEKLRQLNEEPGREFMVSLDRLKTKLQKEKIGVLIDNLEPALDGNGQFVEEHRGYIELLRVLTDSSLRSTTLITSREPLNEGLDIQTLNLGGLKAPVWQTFFSQQGINVDPSVLAEVHKAYGGNALAMKILCAPIKDFYDGDLAAYWQTSKTESRLVVELALENLIREQFDRLQSNSLEVYNLLCRMGCFRYQAVPTVPSKGLTELLWDVSQENHSRIIISLRNCPLIELEKGEYFLHSAIREEAISRLKARSEWEEANRKAAQFFKNAISKIKTNEDALIGFEVINHYLEVDDYEKSASVIFELKNNDEDEFDNFGFACWRLGFSQQIILVISEILESENVINDIYILSGLYRILGYAQNQLGNVHQAIKFHEISGGLSKNYFKDILFDRTNPYHFSMFNMISAYFSNMGLCYFDLGDFETASDYFQNGILLATNFDPDTTSWIEDECFLARISSSFNLFALSLTKSSLGDLKKAEKMAKIAYQKYQSGAPLSAWGRIFSPLLLGKTYQNLGDIDKSIEMHQLALSVAKKNHYKQAIANVTSSFAEIYRKLERFDLACSHHSEAIEILYYLGAKADLAESYFQFGLTYQAMGEHDQAEEYKAKALKLFEQMEAPKQIERVNKAFEQGAIK